MSEPVQLPLVGASHNNQRLFSDHYLKAILPGQWESLKDEAARLMAQLRPIYARFTPNSINEAQTEEDWIKPVLHALGHTFEVQAPLKVPDGIQRPDYIFYNNDAALALNKNRPLDAELLRHSAYAVGDAKSWDRPLDKALAGRGKGGDQFSNKNPSWQIFFYMLHSGLLWGILTNGRKWRLYSAQTAHKLEIFYEVDLPALLEADVESFLYFYAFFRRGAFEDGPLSLENMLKASVEAARGIGDKLRDQVYGALRYVAQGFFEYKANGLTPSPETNKLIYDNSLILLYRLLFLLYAEARGLLPVQENIRYRRQYGLEAIKKEAASDLQEGLLLPDSGLYWVRLKELFKIINLGSPPLTVTTFNGGLFDPGHHPFLEQYGVGDVCLCRAIDKLARVENQFVDYRDLSERHLGTIYEGLLEYNTLFVADMPMVERRSSSKIVPAPDVPKRDVAQEFAPGEVYLVNDRGERKLTGSYYTPDYIVKYMVDETVRPVLDAAIAGAQTDAERIAAVLSINVLDPSMGSGHFPVEVTEYIARYLVELGIQPEESGEMPRSRGASGTGETDLTYWKRRVAQQCIYGVDLNPLAVELAKLSLWLITAARDRPLSFLDHHLRTGNALIGAWLEDVAAGQHPRVKQAQKRAQEAEETRRESGQMVLALFDEAFQQTTRGALDAIAAIEENPGITIKDVKAQEAAYEALRQRFIAKYQRLANLGTAQYYDLPVGSDLWRPLADYALGRVEQPASPQFKDWSAAADAIAERKHFFHWELEFPNIFFDSQGQLLGERAGFDVVISNPPYVRQEKLGPDKPFYSEHYEIYHGVADLFVYFFAQGLRLLRKDGRLAYISSNSWLHANYATTLRQYLREKTTVETVIDLGDNRVFADAPDMTPAIQIVRKITPTNKYVAKAAVFARNEGITSFRDQLVDKLFTLSIDDQPDTGWQLEDGLSRKLFTKLMSTGKPLSEVIQGHMYRGAVSGLNDAFVVDQTLHDRLVREDPNCAVIMKPMLRGEDLRPWYQENEGLWLIFARRGIDINAYPSVLAHLKQFRERLEPRPKDRNNQQSSLGRKPGNYKWYELQDTAEYYELLDKPKIFWPGIGKFPRFSWDEHGQFVNSKGYILLPTDVSLLGILQSRVIWFCIVKYCQPLGERAGLVRYQQNSDKMCDLPIPEFPSEIHGYIGKIAQELTNTAQRRYEVMRKTTYRIAHDLGTAQAKLNQKLTMWWELSFKELRDELVKVFKRDIPLRERDDWEALLRERSDDIAKLTSEIVRLETELNAAVYDVFGLNEEERGIIERETKYRYGEW